MSRTYDYENESDEKSCDSASVSEEKQPEHFWQTVFSWLDDLIMFFSIFILLLSFAIRPVIVDGNSMFPTLRNGDMVLLFNAFYKPERGDVIVVTSPVKASDPIVKRVIGVSGDVIDIDYDTNTVSVNGEYLDEEYINREDADVMENHGLENFSYPYTVPDGKVFCMGDNRNDSRDSRDMLVYGALDEGNILGRVVLRLHGIRSNYSREEKVFGWVK